MSTFTIDINCDMAEGIGNEKELMPWISSANIACGYHAGNEDLMKETVDLCLEYRVAVGAHPSFPDWENFGRTNMNFSSDQIIQIILKQLRILKKIADRQGAKLHHVKPHGALYNMAAKDVDLSRSIAMAVKSFDDSLILYGLSNSVMIKEALKLNLKVANEVFADRTYQSDGTLTPRSQPHALIEREDESLDQVIRFVKEGRVKTISGETIAVQADTICLHGDGDHAPAFAKVIHARMDQEKIVIQPLVQ
jgi:UPF0271 protein